ncbi:BadF/BadG/BcrA/BcrD ATPase family protein [Brachybacterium sacelli]|uniref:N-acetylglucosamine kinase-like BadF-type ATPase n=1 Tax=Brachybacterium sacelli TaxID=173364 RepID=A0ABS4WYW3_9MICO|nr:BadF/BadG/BcrA/BcrD ATPase family protein [Brachybacterium sacelli]MBP2381392.1 N-acetylglucosamine kinase-like BadF-type ATPase [Brachybacterium sacelli]
MLAAASRRGADGPRIAVIDAGKSTVRAAVFAGDHVLARHREEEGFLHPGAPEAQQAVLAKVREVLSRLEHGPYDTVVLATTGVRSHGEAEHALQAALAEHAGCDVLVVNDVIAAYLGALGPRPGVLVQAGTGSLVLGAVEGCPLVHLDGWGHLAGDRGSGFALGRAGLQAACSALDGAGPSTTLTAELTGADPERFIGELYASSTPTKDVAALARSVLRTAAVGDRVAVDVVSAIVSELVDMALAAGRRLGDPQLRDLPVAFVGGLFFDTLFADTVAGHLRARCPEAKMLHGAGDALEGGRLLAATPHDPITHLLTSAFRSEDP